jgi:hypothetical protein
MTAFSFRFGRSNVRGWEVVLVKLVYVAKAFIGTWRAVETGIREGEAPMTDRMTPTVPELKLITEFANEYRQQLVADLAPEFPGREAHAQVAALSIMFATSMTQDPAQQSDQASILNEIMSRWQPVLPWQLVRRSS